jgi:release factor glutamine methyltransferase
VPGSHDAGTPGRPDPLVARLRAAGCVYAEDEAAALRELPPHRLEAAVRRREAGEPLEHVLGWAELGGLRLVIRPGVFVPRRRTLLLVAEAVRLTAPGSFVLDLCCGCGAVGRLLAERVPGLRLDAVDVDERAVGFARQNLDPVGGRVWCGDLTDPLPHRSRGTYATVTANVPYVPSGAEHLVPGDLRAAEPRSTRDGGEDGLDVLRRVAVLAASWLAPGGHVLAEAAEHQVPAALAALAGAGLAGRAVTDGDGTAVVVGRRAG